MATMFSPSSLALYSFSLDPLIDAIQQPKRVAAQSTDVNACKYFLKGTCMRGSTCPYRHTRAVSQTVCKHWLRGLCKKDNSCEYLHEYDLSRMPTCQFYETYGECHNADCQFLHVKAADSALNCPNYDGGFCREGPYCKLKHVRKVACGDYLAGFCAAGPECPFGHPKYEADRKLAAMSSGTVAAIQAQHSSIKRGPISVAEVLCHRCHRHGHFAAECPNAPQSHDAREKNRRPLDSVLCFRCGQTGHYANVCTNERVPPPPGGYKLPGR